MYGVFYSKTFMNHKHFRVVEDYLEDEFLLETKADAERYAAWLVEDYENSSRVLEYVVWIVEYDENNRECGERKIVGQKTRN